MKTTLRARPVFVWTPERIKGHFMMCFLTFVLERELEYRFNKRHIDNSPERIKSALRSMPVSQLSIENDAFYLKGKHQSLASQRCALLKMKQRINMMDTTTWNHYHNLNCTTLKSVVPNFALFQTTISSTTEFVKLLLSKSGAKIYEYPAGIDRKLNSQRRGMAYCAQTGCSKQRPYKNSEVIYLQN